MKKTNRQIKKGTIKRTLSFKSETTGITTLVLEYNNRASIVRKGNIEIIAYKNNVKGPVTVGGSILFTPKTLGHLERMIHEITRSNS